MKRTILWSSTNCLTENRPLGRVVGRDQDYVLVDKFDGKFESLPVGLLKETGMVEVVCDIPKELPLTVWAENPSLWMLLTHDHLLDDLTRSQLLRLRDIHSDVKKLLCVWLLTAKKLNGFEMSLRDSSLLPWLDGSTSYPQPLSPKQTQALHNKQPDVNKHMLAILSKPLSQWPVR